jgi:hypothetical protein
MGQSTNSTAFRLGWKTRWRGRAFNRFDVFSPLFNYTDLFIFLSFFFKRKLFRSLGFIFSHFDYYKMNTFNSIYLEIYLYPSFDFFILKNKFLNPNFSDSLKIIFSNFISWCLQARLKTLGINSVVRVFFLPTSQLTASVINHRIATFLGSRKLPLRLPGSILTVLYNPLSTFNLTGFVIKCAGRFSRRQMATKDVFRFGSVSLSTLSYPVEYSFSTLRLRNGTCSIKVWSCVRK